MFWLKELRRFTGIAGVRRKIRLFFKPGFPGFSIALIITGGVNNVENGEKMGIASRSSS